MNIMVSKLSRLTKNQSGATAVEFALIAPVFFALIFSLFETGWLFTKIALADNAVEQVGRDIYTGAALADATITQDSLKQEICDNVVIINDCMENIALEVRTISSFSDIPVGGETCRDSASGTIQPAATYSPGSSSEISFVRVCITTEILTPFIGVGLALPKNGNDRFEIVSNLAFANEPF